MTITKEQMDRIRRHLNGDKSEALGAWILDRERIAELEKRLEELEAQVADLSYSVNSSG